MKRQTKAKRHTKTPIYVPGSGCVDVTACATNSPSAPVTVTGAVRVESSAEKIARLEATIKSLQKDVKILRRHLTAPKRRAK